MKLQAYRNLKNIYTQEVIEYLMELVDSGEKTYKDLQAEYNIPITTILRWGNKYGIKKDEKDEKTQKENRPFYHKLYADMIKHKYPEKIEICESYLQKIIGLHWMS